MNFIDDCRSFIGVDSATDARAAAEFAGELCARAGLHVTYDEGEEINVVARPGADVPRAELMLQTRLDTRAPGAFGLWTKTSANPFNASVYGDVMYGLGVADAKLDFLCKLEAARDSKKAFVLVGTFGGTSEMTGAIRLLRKKCVNATRALVGEPTELRLVNSGLGRATVQLDVPFSDEERAYRREHDRIETASSEGRVFRGAEPLSEVFRYLTQLPDGVAVLDLHAGAAEALLEIDAVGRFRDPILPKLTRLYSSLESLARDLRFSLARVRTTDDGVSVAGVCRPPAGVADETFARWLEELNVAARANQATVSVKEYRAGFETDATGEYAQGAQDILREMGLDSRVSNQAVTSEANVFSHLGVECLAFGPGVRAAGPNESVRLDELTQATLFYRRMIERFCP